MSLNFKEIQAGLEKAMVIFEPGLTSSEIKRIETTHKFTFPPDLKAFLMHALPVSEGFVHWRKADNAFINDYLAWPYETMCVDIQHNLFWPKNWGAQPDFEAEAYEIARQKIGEAPTLIPVCGHRFMAETPLESGTPVFSIHQSDIIYYGATLEDYFQNEFHEAFGRKQFTLTGTIKQVTFWSDIAKQHSVF